MRKKHAIFLLCILLSVTSTYALSENDDLPSANSDYKKNSVYFELGGNGLFYSFGYDRLFTISDISKFSLGSGIMYLLSEGGILASPQINYLIGNKHNIEIGIGITLPIFISTELNHYIDNFYWFNLYRVGYRYQKKEGGLLFRIGFTPWTFFITGDKVGTNFTWGGIAVGWTF